MTLVVGKINENSDFRIYSDTRVTDEVKQEKPKLFHGVVKSIIYTKEICVSYSGSNVSAEEIHKSIFATNYKLDTGKLTAVLFNFHCYRKNDIDFLISTIQNNIKGFIKISGGKIDINDKSAWIGDIDGFNLFQKEFHSIKENTEKSQKIFDISEEAFNNVILSPNTPTVGGVLITIGRTRNGFEYIMKMKSILGRDLYIDSKTTSAILNFGSAREGSFNYSYLSSLNPNLPAIGIHYFDGNFGVFAFPQKSRNFILYKNVNSQQFIEKVNRDYGVKLNGMMIVKDKQK